MALTDAQVRNAKPKTRAYKLSDARGLYLFVQPNSSRLWRYKFRLAGKENVYTIGKYPDVTLQQAREARDEANKIVKSGANPTHSRHTLRAAVTKDAKNTFQSVGETWIRNKRLRWSPYYTKQVETVLAQDVFPKIGALPIKSVTVSHIGDIIRKVAQRAPSIATLILLWCSQIFRYGIRNRLADIDPTVALKGEIDKPKPKHKHALTKKQLPEFVGKLRESGGVVHVQWALELLLLTFVRPSELRCADWSEFDLTHKEWVIPAARMKMRNIHVVPLSKQAVSFLKKLKAAGSGEGLLFPNIRDASRVMSPTTLNRRIERMGYGGQFSAHGFRATASTLLHEYAFRDEVIEKQLAHGSRSIKATYNHYQYMPARRKMMQWWANFIDGDRKPPSKAVTMEELA